MRTGVERYLCVSQDGLLLTESSLAPHADDALLTDGTDEGAPP